MLEYLNKMEACDTIWQGNMSALTHARNVHKDIITASQVLNERGCDKVVLESLDGDNRALEALVGESVNWREMGSYDLHQFKKRLFECLDREEASAVESVEMAIEGLWSNMMERVVLFMSFESERKECIQVLKEQSDELTSEQKAELENTKVSYATFDYNTAKAVVDNLKNALAICNKYLAAIQKYTTTPSENLNDMDNEYIQEMKEKFEATAIANEDAGTFFAQMITRRVSGKTFKELGYNVGNLASLSQDVSRNVMNFYKQLDTMVKANKRLGNAEAKRGNYGSSDLWDIYSSIFKILRDADRCYKTVEVHLFRTQQKIVRYVNANKAAAAKEEAQQAAR